MELLLSSKIKIYRCIVVCIFLIQLTCNASAVISLPVIKIDLKTVDDSIFSTEIKRQLDHKNEFALYFPNSVKRFYEKNSCKPYWIKDKKEANKTWEAMLMIDCVVQYGFSHADYHPKALLCDQLQTMLEQPDKIGIKEKATFDIMLTDALLNFINNVHFGKLNPNYSSTNIDGGNIQFNAEVVLAQAIMQKDFTSTILNVQPKSNEYEMLQKYMFLLKGQYLDDCYQVSEAEVRKVAINMERLRWANSKDSTYIQVNIPSYTLKFYRPDTVYEFKVIVGKPDHPTPALQSSISYFTTAPEWKVPKSIFIKELLPKAVKNSNYIENNNFTIYDSKGNYIKPTINNVLKIQKSPTGFHATQSSGCDNALGVLVFRFPNIYNVYLHDTIEKGLFKQAERAFSHGCVRVEQVQLLAAKMLTFDGQKNTIPAMKAAIKNDQTKSFKFKNAVPLKIIYLTCEMKDNILQTYKDVYHLDKQLELALYQARPGL